MVKIDPSMSIVINSFNSHGTNKLDISITLLSMDGEINYTYERVTPTTDRAINTKQIPLPEGHLIALTISTTSSSVVRGQCFVTVQIVKSSPGNNLILRQLAAHYLTSNIMITFPGMERESSLSGVGRPFPNGSPATSTTSDLSWEVPDNAYWRIFSIYAIFTTSAVVANRNVFAYYNDGANYIVKTAGTTSFSASTAFPVCAFINGQRIANINYIETLPPIILPPSSTVGLEVVNAQAGDAFSDPILTYEEFIGI